MPEGGIAMKKIIAIVIFLLFVGACHYDYGPRKRLKPPQPSTYGSLRVGQILILQRDALVKSETISIGKIESGDQILRDGTRVQILAIDLFDMVNLTYVEVTVKGV